MLNDSYIYLNTFPLLRNLWSHVSVQRRRQFGLLLILTILVSLAEIISIGAVIPFLGILAAPDQFYEMAIMRPFINFFGLSSPSELLFPLSIVFIFAALLAGAMRLLLLWSSTRLSFATGSELSLNIFRLTLYQPYSVHLSRNSSEVISGIVAKVNMVIYSTILPTLSLISSTIILVAILTTMLIVNPIIAMFAGGGFGLIYYFFVIITRRRVKENGENIATETTNILKSLQEGLEGIRDVLMTNSQNLYCSQYRVADLALRRSQGNNLFLSQSPRYFVESLGISVIAIIAYILVKTSNNLGDVIPTLGALAFGAQRLLPILQQIYAALTDIKGGQASLKDTVKLLNQRVLNVQDDMSRKRLSFKNSIKIDAMSFRHNENASWIFNNLNLEIKKGSRVGFIGKTGSGKSTLMDIIMGLLEPSHGSLKVDGIRIDSSNQQSWRQQVAHVPQSIFLSDESIEKNIALGVPSDEIDHELVRNVAHQAQIASDIASWPDKYDTVVGERGAKLSGGQQQRIGIARALYRQADLIIFDEATSALDSVTERAIMAAIDGLNKDLTLVIVAHRLTTLKKCDQIFELENGIFSRQGQYVDICVDE